MSEDKKPREFSVQELNRRGAVNSNTGCIEYQGARQNGGYGVTTFTGKKKLAHRLSWEFNRGEIPKGICVLHKCDNPPCFNVEHLFIGTKKDNRLDQIKKGRDPAKNASHCRRGHEFTSENLLPNSGRRQCKKCKEITKSAWKFKNKEEIREYKNEWRKKRKENGLPRS